MAYYYQTPHERIVNEVCNALRSIGVPPHRICKYQQIDIPGWHYADADVLVLGEDGKTIVWQIEAKIGGKSPEIAYDQARLAFARIWGMHKCFVATLKDGECFIRRVIGGKDDGAWVDIKDTQVVACLLGDYRNESNAAIAVADKKRKEVLWGQCSSFTRTLWIVGLILLIGAVVGECCGKEFSWKIYYLVTAVVAIFAAANGIVVHVKVGQGEVRICNQKTRAENLESENDQG